MIAFAHTYAGPRRQTKSRKGWPRWRMIVQLASKSALQFLSVVQSSGRANGAECIFRQKGCQLLCRFGPTLAAEHLARGTLLASRETLRKWMSAAGLWRPRNRRVKAVHVRPSRRRAFGELVMMDARPAG